MSIYALLVISHIIGTILGVGGATFAEIFYMRAMKDGEIDPEEGSLLRVIYRVLRVGLFLTVLSGFGFLIYFRLTDQAEQIFDPKLWAKLSMVIIIVINAILLQARAIVFWLGAAISLTSWYAAAILGAWRDYPYDFVPTMIGYVISVGIVAYILHLIKIWYFKRT